MKRQVLQCNATEQYTKIMALSPPTTWINLKGKRPDKQQMLYDPTHVKIHERQNNP